MKVMEYIERQRRRIMERHAGETFISCGGEVIQTFTRPAEEILCEIDCMRGLNVAERTRAGREGVSA